MKTAIVNDFTVTTIGNISTDEYEEYSEDIIKMSTRNFRKILNIIPRTSNGSMIQNTILSIKDDLTELSFKSPHATRKDIINILNTIVEEQSFWNDLEELHELLYKDDDVTGCNCDEISHP